MELVRVSCLAECGWLDARSKKYLPQLKNAKSCRICNFGICHGCFAIQLSMLEQELALDILFTARYLQILPKH
jgi:hypothetical protein